MSLFVGSTVVNTHDIERGIAFWAAALGYVVRDADDTFAVLTDPNRRWSNLSLQLTDEEKRGFELFATEYDPVRGKRGADCFHCHGGVLFSDYAYKNNGLDLAAADAGRAQVTGKAAERGMFKTPSLRNVARTAPYMHDGRFATLEDVVAHYDHDVKRAENLDPNLAKHPDAGLRLSADEQRQLVAFLRTLTDVRYEATESVR